MLQARAGFGVSCILNALGPPCLSQPFGANMKPFLGVEGLVRGGVKCTLESDSPDAARGVVFEDDGSTGYFYARDYSMPQHLFVDALHIYAVEGVTDRDRPSTMKIIWTRDFDAAALLINQRPHAVFHFGQRCGYAQDPFPAADPRTGWRHARIESTIKGLFFSEE